MPAPLPRIAIIETGCAIRGPDLSVASPDNFYVTERPSWLDIRWMCDQIRHRGPDDDGYHIDGRAGSACTG